MKFLSLIIFFCLTTSLFSQTPFLKIFGDTITNQKGIGVSQTDAGYIYLAGTTNEGTIGETDLTLTKLDQSGDILWQNYYGSTLTDNSISFAKTDDDHFLICGNIEDSTGNIDGWVIKIDSSGNEKWQTGFGDSSLIESFEDITISNDDGFLVCGFVTSQNGVGNDYLIVKYDSAGMVMWQKIYGTDRNDYSNAAASTTDGNFIVSGDVQQADFSYRIWTLKLDQNGDTIWSEKIGDYNCGCQSVIENSHGDYIICGESSSLFNSAYDAMLIELSPQGNVEWISYFGGDEAEAAFDLIETDSGNYLVTGYGFNDATQNTDIFLTQTDSLGNAVQSKYYGENALDISYDLEKSNDGGYLIAGAVHHGPDFQYALVYDTIQLMEYNSIEIISPLNVVGVYPNPVSESMIYFSEQFQKFSIQIINSLQQLIYSQNFNTSNDSIRLPDEIPNGSYVLFLQSNGVVYSSKLILAR